MPPDTAPQPTLVPYRQEGRHRAPATLAEKIAAARARGRRHTPSREEWNHATRSERAGMTWPADVLHWIRRGG